MNIRAFLNLLLVALAATAPRLAAQALPQTTAERTNYAATSTNADVGAFLDSLGLAGAPVAVSEMGSSTLGKPIYFVIASDPTVTSPGEAAESGKLVVYLQANIHGGEVEGKEAVLALLRELAGPRRDLLQRLLEPVLPEDLVLAVSDVVDIRGTHSKWTGESVSLPRSYVMMTYQKQFSRSKTVLVATAVAGGIVAIIAGRNLLGFGGGGSPGTTPPDPNGQ